MVGVMEDKTVQSQQLDRPAAPSNMVVDNHEKIVESNKVNMTNVSTSAKADIGLAGAVVPIPKEHTMIENLEKQPNKGKGTTMDSGIEMKTPSQGIIVIVAVPEDMVCLTVLKFCFATSVKVMSMSQQNVH